MAGDRYQIVFCFSLTVKTHCKTSQLSTQAPFYVNLYQECQDHVYACLCPTQQDGIIANTRQLEQAA